MSELMSVSELMGRAFKALENEAGLNAPKEHVTASAGDYLDDSGLLVCGACRERKQCRVSVELPDGELVITPACMCRCGKDALRLDEERRRHEAAMREVERLRRASLMTEKMQGYTFDQFKQRPGNQRVYELLSKYSREFTTMRANNQGLLLWGGVGSGKTFAAMCIGNELLSRGVPVYSTSMVRIMQTNAFADGDNEFMAIANSAELFILDDLGAERGTDTAIERVYGVIDSRSRAGKPMIITTNLSLKQMQSAEDIRYQRIFSRVLEVCYPVEVNGITWRDEAAASRYDAMRAILEGGT